MVKDTGKTVYQTLLFERTGSVAVITLNRPDAANAIDLELSRELLDAALECDENPEIRAVLIRARGKMFCAGGDLGSFAKSDDMPRLLKAMTVRLHAAISRFARMDAPVVAAVAGTAAGAGFSLACACDLVVASESAKFTMAYTRAGLTPDGSSTFFLPRLIGRQKTLDLMLNNPVLTAAEAHALGLVSEVVADESLEGHARSLASSLAEGPTGAFGATKRLVLGSFDQSLETQMELESEAIAGAAHTRDAKEGIAAFFEKRKPEFQGG